MKLLGPVLGCAEPVVPVEGLGVAGPLVAEQRTALAEQRLVRDQHLLVVVADLVAEVAEHRAVRLAEPHAQRLAVGVEGLREVDRDHAVRVADDHGLAAAAGQQVEGQAALPLVVRHDGQAEGEQLHQQPAQVDGRVGELLQGDRVVGVRAPADQPAGEAAARLVVRGHHPVALPRPVGAAHPATAVDQRPVRHQPGRRTARGSGSRCSEPQVGHSCISRKAIVPQCGHRGADMRRTLAKGHA